MITREIESQVDKIIINKKEWKQIEKYRHEQNPNSENQWNTNGKFDARMFFPLNTFILEIDCGNPNVRGLVELVDFNPMNFTYTDEIGVMKVSRAIGVQGFNLTFEQHDKSKRYQVHKDYFDILVIYITSVMIYIIDKAEERRRYERLSPEAERKQREEYEYKDRELFFLNDIIKYRRLHPNRKSIQYRCECWGVRGHIRHLKNGNMIFIKPFKKGRKRDILEPKKKDYLLGGGESDSNTD